MSKAHMGSDSIEFGTANSLFMQT